MKICVVPGTTSVIITVFIKDSSSTVGACLSGLDSTKVAIAYDRDDDGNTGATVVSLSAGTRGTWSSGGFIEKDSVNARGSYQLGVPNAVLAAGAKAARIYIQDAGSNNVKQETIEIQLGPVSAQLADGVAHGGTPGSSTATIAFSRMVGQSQTTDTAAFSMTGNGTAPGGIYQGGATDADGLQCVGGGNNGSGLVGAGGGSVAAVSGYAGGIVAGGSVSSNGDGFIGQAGGVGAGATFQGATNLLSFGRDTALIYGVAGVGDGILIHIAGAGRGMVLEGDGSTVKDIVANLAGTIDGLTAAGLATLFTVNSTKVFADAVTGSPVKEIASNAVGSGGPSAATIATAVWQDLLASSDFSTVASIGKLLKDDINATISSRSTYAGADTGGTTTLLARLTSGRATNLDNLDATVSSRLASASYTTPPTVAAIATAIWTDVTAGDFTVLTSPGKILFAQLGGAFTTTSSSVFTTGALANAPTDGSAPTTAQISTAIFTDLLASSDFSTTASFGKLVKDFLDAAVSSRLAAGSYTAPDNAGILSIETDTATIIADTAAITAIITGSLAELPQATPPALPTISEALMFLYMALRNKSTSTADEATIYNDAGTVIAKTATSDDGTIFIKDQFAAGP